MILLHGVSDGYSLVMMGCNHLKDIPGDLLGKSQTGGSLELLGLLRHIYVSLHKMVIYHGNFGYEE